MNIKADTTWTDDEIVMTDMTPDTDFVFSRMTDETISAVAPAPGEQGGLLMIAQQGFEGRRRNWKAPVKLQALESEDDELLRKSAASALSGQPGVRMMRYQGREAFWAWGAGSAERPFPVVIVPHDLVVAQARQQEQYVLAEVVEGLEVAGLVLLGAVAVVFIASLLSSRRVTVSTIGDIGGMRRLAREAPAVGLAVSLHAPDDETRARLVPGMRRVPLALIIAAAREHFAATGRRVSFEYVLVKDVNDRPEQARALAALLRGFPAFVNVIPLNAVPGSRLQPPSAARARRFLETLRTAHIPAAARARRGADIEAACGQLAARGRR